MPASCTRLCHKKTLVKHWYFYGFDADFGPFYVKFCGYFPYTGQIYLNGHEYAKRQCLKAGIGFTALDNAFGAVSDPDAVQRICDGLTDQKIYRFAGKWLARLPHPFTAGRALCTETTLNQPRDFGIGKELTNLAALAEVGYSANRRLLDAECISHDPAAGAAALEMLTSPVISTTCTRIPGMRFPDPRVQALLGACCALALRPAGFTSRDLRHYLAPQLGKLPEDMTGGQISYDLRRLRAHQIIERIPHSRAYQVTEDGLALALFFTRLTRRVLIPALAQLTDPGPPPGTRLRQADRAYQAAITELAQQASIAA